MPPVPSVGLALYLIVRVYDTTDLTAATLVQARRAAEDTLRAPNVQMMWRTCPPVPGPSVRNLTAPDQTVADNLTADRLNCERPLESQELVVRITKARAETAAGWLGYSYVDTAWRTGALATVFADRIASTAEHLGMEPGTLMGRAMAHELIHLILGTTTHTRSGLMRADWTSPPRPDDWTLSRAEAGRLQRGLIARMSTTAPPPVVATGQPDCRAVACAGRSELLSTRP